MTFRQLTARQLEEARGKAAEESEGRSMRLMAGIGDASKLLSGLDAKQIEEARKQQSGDVLMLYDARLLLRYGLIGAHGPNYGDEHVMDGAEKDDMDSETDKWARLQILDVSGITAGESQSSVTGSDQTNGTEPIHLPISASSGSQS